jgi:hypothetical protein
MYHHHQHLLSSVAAATTNAFRELAGSVPTSARTASHNELRGVHCHHHFPFGVAADTAKTFRENFGVLFRSREIGKDCVPTTNSVARAMHYHHQIPSGVAAATTTGRPLVASTGPSTSSGPLCYYVLCGPPSQASVLLHTASFFAHTHAIAAWH